MIYCRYTSDLSARRERVPDARRRSWSGQLAARGARPEIQRTRVLPAAGWAGPGRGTGGSSQTPHGLQGPGEWGCAQPQARGGCTYIHGTAQCVHKEERGIAAAPLPGRGGRDSKGAERPSSPPRSLCVPHSHPSHDHPGLPLPGTPPAGASGLDGGERAPAAQRRGSAPPAPTRHSAAQRGVTRRRGEGVGAGGPTACRDSRLVRPPPGPRGVGRSPPHPCVRARVGAAVPAAQVPSSG